MAAEIAAWDEALKAIRYVIDGDAAPSVPLPQRKRLRMFGAATLEDNETDDATELTIPAVAGATGPTGPTGPTGAGGATGPTGAAAPFLSTELAYFMHPGDATAVDQITAGRWFSAGFAVEVDLTSFLIYPSGAVTANDTSYATIEVYAVEDGGSSTLIATASTTTTGTGSWSADNSVPLDILSPPLTLSPAVGLKYRIVKVVSGVQLPAFRLVAGGVPT